MNEAARIKRARTVHRLARNGIEVERPLLVDGLSSTFAVIEQRNACIASLQSGLLKAESENASLKRKSLEFEQIRLKAVEYARAIEQKTIEHRDWREIMDDVQQLAGELGSLFEKRK